MHQRSFLLMGKLLRQKKLQNKKRLEREQQQKAVQQLHTILLQGEIEEQPFCYVHSLVWKFFMLFFDPRYVGRTR